jgi:hypothetical protein
MAARLALRKEFLKFSSFLAILGERYVNQQLKRDQLTRNPVYAPCRVNAATQGAIKLHVSDRVGP